MAITDGILFRFMIQIRALFLGTGKLGQQCFLVMVADCPTEN